MPYMVAPNLNAQIEVKNTFLQFPIHLVADTPQLERRSASCPTLPRLEEVMRDSLGLLGHDDSKGKDVSGESTDGNSQECGIASCSSLEDSTIDSPLGLQFEMEQHSHHHWQNDRMSPHGGHRMHHQDGLGRSTSQGWDADSSQRWGYEAEGRGSSHSRYAGHGVSMVHKAMASEDHSWGSSPAAGASKSKKFGGRKSCLLLRGLPFSATETDVANFVEHAGVLEHLAPGRAIVLLNNPQGRPSGFAEVHLANTTDIADIRDKLHMQRLGTRYIEVLWPHPPKWGGSSGGGGGGGGGGYGGYAGGAGSGGSGNRHGGWRR